MRILKLRGMRMRFLATIDSESQVFRMRSLGALPCVFKLWEVQINVVYTYVLKQHIQLAFVRVSVWRYVTFACICNVASFSQAGVASVGTGYG